MAGEVALRNPEGAIAEFDGRGMLESSLHAIKDSLVDMVNTLTVEDGTPLGKLITSAGERLDGMLLPGGLLDNDPENLVATVKVLNDIRIRSVDVKRKCLDTAIKAYQLLESKTHLTSLTVSLGSTGEGVGATVPVEEEEPTEGGAEHSSYSHILSNPTLMT
jgi:hypothetical protein